MKNSSKKNGYLSHFFHLSLVALAALGLCLAIGCTPDKTADSVGDAARDAADVIGDAADDIGDATEDTTDAIKDATN